MTIHAETVFRHVDKPITAGPYTLPIHQRTLVMGILNVTPDSFSDGGRYHRIEKAVEHARQMVEEGADIIDIGGESTRPQSTTVSLDEELSRVIPIVEALSQVVEVPLSVDTYKGEVAWQSIQAGAHMINDVWGFKKDPDMAQIAAELRVPVILMHNREVPHYQDLMADICADLMESVNLARQAGVQDNQIILDPGIGFAKSHTENLIVMNHLEQVVHLGYPVLLGTSRKSMIGKTLDLPVDQRVEGTGATVTLGITKGCNIVRVHDVKEMVRIARMTDAMVRAQR